MTIAVLVSTMVVSVCLLAPVDADSRGSVGPDIVASEVGDRDGLPDFDYLNQINGISSFRIASTSCNLGDTIAQWIDGGRNPVIAQNLYRMADDGSRIEHIGMSFLKYSFCAVSQSGDNCPPTCQATGCNSLGIGCADTYHAGLNDGFNGGPRWNINPVGVGANGVHDGQDPEDYPVGNPAIAGRLQVHHADIEPGYRYFAEIQYVTHDEALPMRWNNASYREVVVTATSMTPTDPSSTDTHIGDPAIQAWQDNNPAVQMVAFEDDPGVGRFNLGCLVTDNGNGTWTYEYALHNLNSNRAANRLVVSVPVGVFVSDTGFHDVHYHSNDGWNGTQNFDGTDWPAAHITGEVRWATADFNTDPNANALRWGSMYNFRLTADTPPVSGEVTIGMYKGGGRDVVTILTQVPDIRDCPADIATSKGPGADGVVNLFDLLLLIDNWATNGPGAPISGDGGGVTTADLFDLLELLDAWGTCSG